MESAEGTFKNIRVYCKYHVLLHQAEKPGLILMINRVGVYRVLGYHSVRL